MINSLSNGSLKANIKNLRSILFLKVFYRNRSMSCAIIAGTMCLTVASEVEAQGAGVASSAAAAVTAVNAYYQLNGPARDLSLRKVNQSLTIDLSNKRVCVVPRGAFQKIKNAAKVMLSWLVLLRSGKSLKCAKWTNQFMCLMASLPVFMRSMKRRFIPHRTRKGVRPNDK